MLYAIETTGITKIFEGVTAVNNVSISVKTGELFGLLGPNGAGKTTLINMLSTMTEPSGGSARIWDFDISRDASAVRQSIGVVFQDTTLDDRLTGRENLDLHGRLYGMDSKNRKKRIEEVLSLVELTDRADSIVKTYSGGMMRRLEIARGLMHHPHVLFLDEPTLGLDPQTRNHIWEYIKILNKEEGVTIVLTTHYMEEADQLCGRIAIIDHGRIVALDTPVALKSRLGGDVITLGLENPADMARLCDIYKKNGCAEIVSLKKNEVFITVREGERQIPHVLNLALNAGIPIQSVSLRKPTLDDVFLHHTGRAIRDKEASEAERVGYIIRSRRK
ncbi:daunorubicin resistance ABC transporter ATP-binding subunit [Candidatus Methanoperedens nitroreducens]|uniref:Daunorubicin resistance ABC transporter ATP-binding subunit n=1 Tax=Candidatus Methanoperedens nitratireducens TaxID=1392998 RepID=A0A062V7E7_9EURY|nr:ATP-binding cassette domain-containing protein [Candidatus Methanoperedens nitroreducens]KCZ71315.1 daunorubicin resistance ABC transporter ATP-binding subunit [Candidatus Methanoperedens nitroreducens]MDJ1420941.1 ATP-binding cassette domain-containing protein [Candidatus Methanoperedens sp.]